VSYEDLIRISTPEGVDLELILAGLGSRMAAGLLDGAIRTAAYVIIIIVFGVLAATGRGSAALLAGVLGPVFLLSEVGYYIAFEVFGSGRTPGKRALGLRVVKLGGQPVDFRTSAVRNIVRLIDGILTVYVAGIVSILFTARNQRLGDLAAGTIVVREQRADASAPRASTDKATARLGSWDVSAVSPDEIATVRRFLERRDGLAEPARDRIARDLFERLRSKVAGAPVRIEPETFLESLVRAKAMRR
jgi:uncharacterized RDD family membrane protein YckC